MAASGLRSERVGFIKTFGYVLLPELLSFRAMGYFDQPGVAEV